MMAGLVSHLVLGTILLAWLNQHFAVNAIAKTSRRPVCLLSEALANGAYVDNATGDRLRSRRVRPGHVIEAQCDSGYGRRGAKLRRCNAKTKEFDKDAPICEDIDECYYSELVGVASGDASEWEPSSVEDSWGSSEDDLLLDFDLSALPMVSCHSRGHCVNTPGSFRCECNEGYEGDGIHSCRELEQKACEPLQPPAHGSMSGSPDRLVRFSCNEGYRIYGAESRRCSDGKWTGLHPVCEVVGCGDPGTPTNGDKFGSKYDVGNHVYFYCEEGYELVGPGTRVCLDGGDDFWSHDFWSGVQPVCRPVSKSVVDIAQKIQTDFVDHLEVFTHAGRGRLAVSDNIGLDLVFAYDTSSSLNRVNFERGVNFTESLLREFGVSYDNGGTRVATISFDNAAEIVFTYGNDVDTFEKVMTRINRLKDNLGGGTALGDALELVFEVLKDMRNGSKRALFLMTDGMATVGVDPASIAKSLRQDERVEIFVVAVGQAIDQRQLRKIASQPYSTHVFLLENFEDLAKLTAIISEKGVEYKRCGQAGNLELPYGGNQQKDKNNANPGAWPWLAQILTLTKNGPFLQCGGALLCGEWVVTAGSCAWNESGISQYPSDYFRVRLGAYQLGVEEDTQREFGVSEVHIHEDYDPGNRYNDIALLKLNQSVNLTSNIRTLCVPSEIELVRLKPSSLCYIAGWGIVDPIEDQTRNASMPSVFPQQLKIPLVNDRECREAMQRPYPYDGQRKLCAGTIYQTHEACRGDTGTPLVCQQIDGSWAVSGIASYTKECTDKRKFDVFTRINELMTTWLHRQTANCTEKYEAVSVGGFHRGTESEQEEPNGPNATA